MFCRDEYEHYLEWIYHPQLYERMDRLYFSRNITAFSVFMHAHIYGLVQSPQFYWYGTYPKGVTQKKNGGWKFLWKPWSSLQGTTGPDVLHYCGCSIRLHDQSSEECFGWISGHHITQRYWNTTLQHYNLLLSLYNRQKPRYI